MIQRDGTLPRASPLPKSMPTDALRALQQASLLEAQGRLWEAEQLYETALGADARHFGMLCRLGVIRLRRRRVADAAALFRRGLKSGEKFPHAHPAPPLPP